MNPWAEDDPPPKRSSWGCAIAAIIGSIATIIAVIIVLNLANSVL